MADGIVSGDIEIEGVPEAIRELELVKARLEDLSRSTPSVRIDLSALEKAGQQLDMTGANISRIIDNVSKGAAVTVADIKAVSTALNGQLDNLAVFKGRSNEATAWADRVIATLTSTMQKIVEGNVQVEASAAALDKSSQARLEASLARHKAEAEASAAKRAKILADNEAIIASNDAVVASNDKVAKSGGSTRSARNATPFTDYRDSEVATQSLARDRATTDKLLAINPDDTPEIKARKSILQRDEQLQREADDRSRKLQDNKSAQSISQRRKDAEEMQRVADEFDRQNADREAKKKYYQTSQPVQADYVQRYNANKAPDLTQQVEAQYQQMVSAPIDPTLSGAPAINAAVNKRQTDAAAWRSAQLKQIKDASDMELENVQIEARMRSYAEDRRMSGLYQSVGADNIAVGGPPLARMTQDDVIAAQNRRNQTIRNPATGMGPGRSAATGGGGGGGTRSPAGRMPIRGSAANRYGRSFAPSILPQDVLDANFEEAIAASPPTLEDLTRNMSAAEKQAFAQENLTPRQLYEMQAKQTAGGIGRVSNDLSAANGDGNRLTKPQQELLDWARQMRDLYKGINPQDSAFLAKDDPIIKTGVLAGLPARFTDNTVMDYANFVLHPTGGIEERAAGRGGGLLNRYGGGNTAEDFGQAAGGGDASALEAQIAARFSSMKPLSAEAKSGQITASGPGLDDSAVQKATQAEEDKWVARAEESDKRVEEMRTRWQQADTERNRLATEVSRASAKQTTLNRRAESPNATFGDSIAADNAADNLNDLKAQLAAARDETRNAKAEYESMMRAARQQGRQDSFSAQMEGGPPGSAVGGGGNGGGGGRRRQAAQPTVNLGVEASSADDAVTQIRNFQQAADRIRAQGGRVNLQIEASGGIETEAELRKVTLAAQQITGKEGTATVHITAIGADKVLAQMETIAAVTRDPLFANIKFTADTTGQQDIARIAREGQQARRDARDEAQADAYASREAAAIAKQNASEEADYLREVTTRKREAAAAAREQTQAENQLGKEAKAAADAEAAADKARTRPFIQTANTQSRSILGVPAELAAPVAAAAGVGIAGKEAIDYQTLLVQTGNQTNLTTQEIDTMNQTIRSIPDGSANLAPLALGFKNITDLGYSASDAQRMATEESKAATAAGSDQATVMLAITSSMKDYNATAEDVAKFTNTTVEAARLANSTFENWADTTRRATAIAAAYKVPLSEVDAMLVALTRHGFTTAQANTQVAGLIQNLVAPTPTASREIADLSKRTGVDLVTDFSQQGLAAKGSAGVFDDIAKAVNGDEAEIRRLIPALRGGQAALLLTTTASLDFKDALDLLGKTVDGSLTPVEEGFKRIQNTVGYQVGQTLKQLKLDAIDVGQSLIPVADTTLRVFQAIPPGVQKSTMEMILFGLASKALAISVDFVQAGATKYAASELAAAGATATAAGATATATGAIAAQNTVLAQNTAILSANTMGWRNNAISQDEALFPKVATGVAEGAVLGGTASLAPEAIAVEAGFAAKATGALATAAAAVGPFIVPVTIGLAVGKIAGDALGKPLVDWFAQNVLGKDSPADRANKSMDAQTADEFLQNVVGLPDPTDAVRVARDYMQQLDDEIKGYQDKKISTLNPFDSTNENLDAEINVLVDRKKKIGDAAANRLAGLDPTARQKALQDNPDDAQAQADQEAQDTQTYQLLETRRADLLAKGAPERLVNTALFSDDFSNLTKTQVEQANKDLTEWEKQYALVQTAAKNAQTAIDAVDLSKGISGLVGQASNLAKINTELNKVGEGNTAISNLSMIAGKFKDIQDAEDQARSAFDGFMLGITESDRRISVLDALTKKVTDATAAAQASVDRGTGTNQDRQLIASSPDILANIARDKANLQSGQIPDILGASANVPKYTEFQNLTKQAIDQLGGSTTLEVTAQTDVTEAKNALTALVNGPWTAHITTQYDNSNQPPMGPSSFPSSGPNANSGSGDTAFDNPLPNGTSGGTGTTYTPNGGPRFNTYRPLSRKQYDDIVQSQTHGKQSYFDTPEAYSGLVIAAQLQGVDPRALLAGTAFESGDGTTSSETQNANLNFSGIKFAGQAGASQAERVTDGTGGYYARFDTPYDYFTAYAKNMSTGDYTTDYNNGDLAAVNRRYVAGTGTPTDDQQANIDKRTALYYQYLTRYPADPGATGGVVTGTEGGPSGPMPWANPLGNTPYTITQRPFASPSADNPNPSHANLGAYDLAVPNETPLYSVGHGTVVESGFSNAGYGKSEVIDYGNGIKARYGHLSTLGAKVGDVVDPGQEIGLSGSTGNSTGPHLHFEVTVNGKEVDPKSIGFNFDDPAHMGIQPTATSPVNNPGSQNDNGPADPRYKVVPMYNATDQARLLGQATANFGPGDASRLQSAMGTFDTYAKQTYENKPEYFGNKSAADNEAEKATLNYAIIYARTLSDIRNHTGNIAQDYRDLVATGGAVGANAVAWLQTQAKIDDITKENRAAQAEMKQIDDTAFNRNISRQQDDQLIAAKALNDSRINEDDDITLANKNRQRDRGIADQKIIDQNNFDTRQRNITNATNSENDTYTFTTQREEQDKQRALQFNQQTGATLLQNKITDLEKQQTNAVYNRTTEEQLTARAAAAAGTNAAGAPISGQLALMHEGDLATRDANKKALDDLQALQKTQALGDSKASFDLETEILTKQRAHEDTMHNIDLESRQLTNEQQDYAKLTAKNDLQRQRDDEDAAVRLAASRLQQKRADEDAAVRLANQRTEEDRADAIRKKQLQDTIDKNNLLNTDLVAYQGTLDGVLSTFQSLATAAGATADPFIRIVQAVGDAAGNPVAIPPASQSGAGYSRRLGTHAAGGDIPLNEQYSVVGDNPDGSWNRTTEVIHAPGLSVTNLRTLMATPPAPMGTAGGSNITIPISIVPGNDDETIIARAHAALDLKLRTALAEMRADLRSTQRRAKAASGYR